MIDISVNNRQVAKNSNIGAIVCHTPKTIYISDSDVKSTSQSCLLIDNIDDLNKYFGDPLVDPTIYSDLILARDLILRGVPLYISSVYEMKDHDDGFTKILYNGYTEFYFKENGFDVVGYKLKSEVKFCQPIISSISMSNEDNQLHLYVQVFHLDRGIIKKLYTLNKPDESLLYKTLHFTFDANTVTDEEIISDFNDNELELHVVFSGGDDRALSKELIKQALPGLKVLLTSLENNSTDYIVNNELYRYDIHSSDYSYYISDDESASEAYLTAVSSLSSMLIEPIMLYVGRMFHSVDLLDTSGILYSSKLEPISPEFQIVIYNSLLDLFPEYCNTYLLISMPDVSVSSALDILNQAGNFTHLAQLNDQYNCDLFFGYATDIINTSHAVPSPRKVYYSSALLSFYNLMLSSDAYLTNNFIDLNISNRTVKLVLTEASSKKLQINRCNSMVLFDTGSPSVYGDRSLSTLPNLRYSHVSRNFVAIRRIINNYLETKKFTINITSNIDSCMCYIKLSILDKFVSLGVLSDYSASYYSKDQSVFIKIILTFPFIAESISLNFTI